MPAIDRAALVMAYFTIVASNAARLLDRAAAAVGRPLDRDGFETVTWFLRQLGARLTAAELLAALEEAQRAGRLLAAFHQRYDVLVTSTLGTPPKQLGELGPTAAQQRILATLSRLPLRPLLLRALSEMGPEALEALPNTQLFNLTGQPAASVPMGWTPDPSGSQSGLPLAVQLAGRCGDEGLLLQLAAQIEAARPWADRLPPTAAAL